jgi:hypothetical protein
MQVRDAPTLRFGCLVYDRSAAYLSDTGAAPSSLAEVDYHCDRAAAWRTLVHCRNRHEHSRAARDGRGHAADAGLGLTVPGVVVDASVALGLADDGDDPVGVD